MYLNNNKKHRKISVNNDIGKNHFQVNVYGSIDELNSLLGVVLTKLKDKRIKEFINQIQKDLFLLSNHLAGAESNLNILSQRIDEMEKVIDALDKQLPLFSNFILPEGVEPAALLYFVRSVARRAERELVALSIKSPVDKEVLAYFNRLSDLLFVLARFLNLKAGVVETPAR